MPFLANLSEKLRSWTVGNNFYSMGELHLWEFRRNWSSNGGVGQFYGILAQNWPTGLILPPAPPSLGSETRYLGLWGGLSVRPGV